MQVYIAVLLQQLNDLFSVLFDILLLAGIHFLPAGITLVENKLWINILWINLQFFLQHGLCQIHIVLNNPVIIIEYGFIIKSTITGAGGAKKAGNDLRRHN